LIVRVNSDWQTAVAVLRNLEKTLSRFSLLRGSRDEEVVEAACRELAAGNPAELLPVLAPFVWSKHPVIQRVVSAIFQELALRVPPGAWARVDEEFRSYGMLPVPDFDDDPAKIITGACHPVGFVRERAIKQFGLLPPLIASCLLLVRVNDWVQPIRERARNAFAPLLGLLNGDQKLAILPLIERLRHCGRHQPGPLAEQWKELLGGTLEEDQWLRAWQQSPPKEKRSYVDLIKISGRLPSPLTQNAILRSNDRFALLWFIRDVLPQLDESQRLAADELLSQSRAVPVRREWITSLVENSPKEAVEKLKVLLTDASASLRSFARFYLSRLAPMDFTEHYSLLLKDSRREAIALSGLAEVAPDLAHSEAISRLQSPVPAVRKAAILALKEDSLNSRIDWLFEQAQASMPGVAKAAKKRLSQISELGSHLITHPEQFPSFDTSLQTFLVRLSPRFAKWDALEFLLRCSSIASLQEVTSESLSIWSAKLNRSFIHLSPTKRATLIGLAAEATISERLREHLLFLLKES
jgi:hypothetical protein